ncbi:hypothetical protein SSBR45G_12380 [Bradyrhizobium sp. SSBR45G]|uniref:DUF4386 family protein n=1 Tax=unclassified Bradyrhizobium TaxID=2631580 RepID=UPI0023429845|nr:MULTISPECIES: DUF4386 family protein [unclassified Bradyrhizobium]GLH76330.1 hypothetical protein SSBR45G_12380 [Bradyrhizobium sp. SSBR45G]GLH83186.1 hypothetical protein SSBR45R_06460 [Bradyrhizobium sp. SSBR45R]
MTTASPAAPMTRAELLTLVLLVAAQVVLFLVPLIVLGRAISWPASLRLPASEALPLIAGHAMAVQIGYWGYLLTATAMVPLALALRRFAQAQGLHGGLSDTMAAMGVAAAVLKTLGIVRWLSAMPNLAGLHAATTDPIIRVAAEVSYVALNSYAGSVGELLGVQLFSGLWLMLVGIMLLRTNLGINGIAGLVIGAAFATTALRSLVPAFEILSTIVPPLALGWFAVLAVTLARLTARASKA